MFSLGNRHGRMKIWDLVDTYLIGAEADIYALVRPTQNFPGDPKRAINGPPTSNRGNQERSWRPQSQKSDQCSEKLEEVMAGDLR